MWQGEGFTKIGRTVNRSLVDHSVSPPTGYIVTPGLFKDFGKVTYSDEEKRYGLPPFPTEEAALAAGISQADINAWFRKGGGTWCNFKIDAGGSCANARSMFGAGVGTQYVKLNQSKMPHCRGMVRISYVTKTSLGTVFIGVNALFPLFTLVIGTIFFYAFLRYSGHWAEEGGVEHQVEELYAKVFADVIAQTQANPTAAGKAAGQTQASPTKAQLEMVETEASTDARV